MPYCGCAGDCLAAGVWRILLTVALCGLVHVELMFSDGGLDGAVVLGRGRVRVRMRVRMRMRMGGRELGGDAVLGRGRKLGWWVGLGHGWIRGRRCVLVTLRRRKRFSVTCFAWRLNVDGTWIWKSVAQLWCSKVKAKLVWVKMSKIHYFNDVGQLKIGFHKILLKNRQK